MDKDSSVLQGVVDVLVGTNTIDTESDQWYDEQQPENDPYHLSNAGKSVSIRHIEDVRCNPHSAHGTWSGVKVSPNRHLQSAKDRSIK
jgi:hypothetical protein